MQEALVTVAGALFAVYRALSTDVMLLVIL